MRSYGWDRSQASAHLGTQPKLILSDSEEQARWMRIRFGSMSGGTKQAPDVCQWNLEHWLSWRQHSSLTLTNSNNLAPTPTPNSLAKYTYSSGNDDHVRQKGLELRVALLCLECCNYAFRRFILKDLILIKTSEQPLHNHRPLQVQHP